MSEESDIHKVRWVFDTLVQHTKDIIGHPTVTNNSKTIANTNLIIKAHACCGHEKRGRTLTLIFNLHRQFILIEHILNHLLHALHHYFISTVLYSISISLI